MISFENFTLGPYLFRSYQSGDEKAIQTVVFNVLESYGLIPEPEGVDSDLKNIQNSYKNGVFGVIEFNNSIIGSFGMTPISDQLMEIRKMYILEVHRGIGLGSAALNCLCNIARLDGYKRVELETASVLKEAIFLYERRGFIKMKKESLTARCNLFYGKEL